MSSGTEIQRADGGEEPARSLPEAMRAKRRGLRAEEITVDNVELFLNELQRTGLWTKSAERAGLSLYTVRKLEKDDGEFKELTDEAMQVYKDDLVAETHRRAVDGWDEPVFSQRTGTQIGTVRKYDSKLLELMLKRHIPEFREKFEGTINVTGGVLVAPAATPSVEDWAKQYGGNRLPAAEVHEGEVVEVKTVEKKDATG